MLQSLSQKKVEEIILIAKKDKSEPTPLEDILKPTSFDQFVESLKKGGKRRDALRNAMEKLSTDEFEELVALMWLGRGHGSFSFKGWKGQASGTHISYLIGKVLLDEYLQKGLEKTNKNSQC